MPDNKPPFTVTDRLVILIADICEQIGKITMKLQCTVNQHQRRENRIRTIHSSLAIEHNTLTIDQVTAIIDGKRVLGNPNEIQEVKNAHEAYELMLKLDPNSVEDLLSAHRLMMKGLVPENGRFRSKSVGIFDGEQLIHMAPPADLVPKLIADLFEWYKTSEVHPLIKSAVFHYEFEFIHPFADGNGRMGRMWHSLLLGQWKELFYWLPIEEMVRSRQAEYYKALGKADKSTDSAIFVELMLDIIYSTLKDMENVDRSTDQVSDQDTDQDDNISRLTKILGDTEMSAAEIMNELGLSHRPTFRKNYLDTALNKGIIERTIPDKPNSKNQKYRKVK